MLYEEVCDEGGIKISHQIQFNSSSSPFSYIHAEEKGPDLQKGTVAE